jgi:hypothetical protein
VKSPAPIEDREPQVTERLRTLLAALSEGRLTPSDFAYVRTGFFPDAANFYRKELETLGVPVRMQLLERRERGDDRIYLYELTFATGSRHLSFGLAPDDRASSFSMWSKP